MSEAVFDLATFKTWARTEIQADDNLNHAAGLAAVELLGSEAARSLDWIDVATATATPRTFRPLGPCTRILPIDDAAQITAVSESGSALTVDVNYSAEPLGNRSGAGEYRPFDHLIRINAYWYVDDVKATVTVTAKWGWAAIPPVAVEAVKVLAQDWAMMRSASNGVIGSTDTGFSIGMRENPLVVRAVNAIRGAKASPFGG